VEVVMEAGEGVEADCQMCRENPVKDKFRLKWMTVVDPSEYDIEKQMQQLVRNHNQTKEMWMPTDVGKVIGLYLAWKELKEKKP
jgi:hypothetical protein